MAESHESDPSKPRPSTDEETEAFINKEKSSRFGYQEIISPSVARQKSLWARTVTKLGWFQLAVLIGGSIGLLAGIGVLRYLWPWPSRVGSDRHWEAIVFSGWLLRAITLSCIVIRISMAMQATIFSMVMASIALQRSKVLVEDAAAVSIFRFTNSGPHHMILPLYHACKEWKSSLGVLITVLVSITTIASQFTSTILLTDIGTLNLKTREIGLNVSYGGDGSQSNEFFVGTTTSKWDGRPSTFQVFAENSSSDIELKDHPNGGAVFATGNNLRAFMPLTKQDRLFLAEYHGPATVIDSRVVCTSPYIMELTATTFDNSDINIHGVVSANTINDYSDELSRLGFFAYNNRSAYLADEITFDCEWPGQMNNDRSENFTEWKVSLCQLSKRFADDKESSLGVKDLFGGDLDLGFVVINMTGSTNPWRNITVNETEIGFGKKSDGEWVTLSYQTQGDDGGSVEWLDLSISLCFTSFLARNALITASASWHLTEPVLSKDLDAPRYNTTLIRNHLGVGNDKTADLDYANCNRGILALEEIDDESIRDLSNTKAYIKESLIDQSMDPNSHTFNYPTARMCIWCGPNVRVHEGFIAIFNDVLVTTSHPALAIQAFFTARALQIYDERSPDFQFSKIAYINLFRPFQVPTSMKGLYAVCAVISLHLVLMLYVVFLFFKIDEQTSLGQAWQTIGQIHGEDLQDVLAVAKVSTDSEVRKWLVENRERDTIVGLQGENVVRKARPITDLPPDNESVFNSRPQSILSFRSRSGS